MNTTEPTAIARVAQIMGSQRALATALGVTPATVNGWVQDATEEKSRPVPVKQCVRIEGLTGGRVTRKDLRPDDWRDIWPELAANSEQKPAPALDGQALGAIASEA